MTSTVETHPFQAETRELLALVIHSLYAHKEIFLRELVSNASDALDKLRFEALTHPEYGVAEERLAIQIELDPARRTLEIRDNGIGMSRAEVTANIGTIARSGTREFRRALEKAGREHSSGGELPDLIGQFGVGFYSAFMVAEEVELETRRVGESRATRWRSRGERLQDPDGVKHDANHGPKRHRGEAQLRPPDDRTHGEQQQVRVTPRGDQAESGIETSPCVHLEFEQPEEDAFLNTAEDITDHDDDQHQVDILAEDETGNGAESARPSDVPEWRVDEIDTMIEDIAPLGRRQGEAGKLAVDGIEERHKPGCHQSRQKLALDEQHEGDHNAGEAYHRHDIRADPLLGRPFCRVPCRPRPHPLRHQVGDALVGALEHPTLDRRHCVGREGHDVRRLALFQGMLVSAGKLPRLDHAHPLRQSGHGPDGEAIGDARSQPRTHMGGDRDGRACSRNCENKIRIGLYEGADDALLEDVIDPYQNDAGNIGRRRLLRRHYGQSEPCEGPSEPFGGR